MSRNVLLILAGGVLALAATIEAAPAGPSSPAGRLAAPAAASATDEIVVDCGAEAFASTEAGAASAGLPSQTAGSPFPASGDTQQVGTSCRRVGSGPFGYCDGSCRYTHMECAEIIDSTGFRCGCRIRIAQ